MHLLCLLYVEHSVDERGWAHCEPGLSGIAIEKKNQRYFSGIAAHLDPPDLADLDLSLRINSCRRRTWCRSAHFVLRQLTACDYVKRSLCAEHRETPEDSLQAVRKASWSSVMSTVLFSPRSLVPYFLTAFFFVKEFFILRIMPPHCSASGFEEAQRLIVGH